MDIQKIILALGAESCGRFSYLSNDEIFTSKDFGDLIEEDNFQNFSKEVIQCIEENGKPDKVLIDLHPEYNPSRLGEALARKWRVPLIKIQHHLAHIHTVAYENSLKNFMGIALDGTGLGFDGKIWGGEIFRIKNKRHERAGSLEEQILIGADLAVNEPARVLMSVLAKFLNKEEIKNKLKKFYSENEFELLFNQLQQNFNCQLTSSTGRILDAVSCLLFNINKRDFKHQATKHLEENSTIPFKDLKLVIKRDKENIHRLQTTPLFEYLIKNIKKDKKRLAATSQKYLAEGILEIIKKTNKEQLPVVAAGGLSKIKVFQDIFQKNKVILAQKIPAGDCGISIGQIYAYLNLTNPGN
jgi:hydrogenase maturation protein HypF